ncbi:IclR family transcriptional regulator [Sphingomonas canadensis]|uniref:IclR family transcriptional regulator n=1 Tax=Sphingomonas canadensis TaxID=1219257 RepID=A0ABW3H1W3_9SPHN|nr:IclR family transcriptional regulator C-terminal domain-containing protein [Sphingomonas canadensis]MCW3834723.1 helix-turn-helix domain-containing protein [Sphingomonas canadensis]
MTTSDRVLSILNLFTFERPEWTVEEAAQHLNLAVSTAYRYFKSLNNAGLVVAFNPGRYVLGPAIMQYDRQIRLRDPLLATAKKPMMQLAEWLPPQSMVLLCGLYRTEVMCTDQQFVQRPDYAVSYERGRLMPIYAGSPGQIILAHLSSRAAKAMHQRYAVEMAASGLGSSWEEVRRALRRIRAEEISTASDGQEPGQATTSVGMFGHDGAVVGSLSTVMPARAQARVAFDELKRRLLDAAQTIRAGIALLAQSDRAAEFLRRSGEIAGGEVRPPRWRY